MREISSRQFRLVVVSMEARDHMQYLGIVWGIPLILVRRNWYV
jgi:hypothetical protein